MSALDRVRVACGVRASVDSCRRREVDRVPREVDHAQRSGRNFFSRKETLDRRAREEEVFLSRVSAGVRRERRRSRRSHAEREKSEKITVDDGFNVSGTRGEVRGDSE